MSNKGDENIDAPESILKRSVFTDHDILSMLLAAIGHDLDHSGLPNSYMAKVEHLDPKVYGDARESK